MKKFECNACGIRICTAEYQSRSGKPWCCTTQLYGVHPDWHEVIQDNTQDNTRVKLPDWCKVGEYVYDSLLREYCCVKKEEAPAWYINNIESGRIKQAHKRKFNEKEMKALLGKVIVDGESEFFVSAYYGEVKYLAAGVFCEFDAQSLMRCTCEGKPCYVLEHLENGEWVR